jgi:hypothetical protein
VAKGQRFISIGKVVSAPDLEMLARTDRQTHKPTDGKARIMQILTILATSRQTKNNANLVGLATSGQTKNNANLVGLATTHTCGQWFHSIYKSVRMKNHIR